MTKWYFPSRQSLKMAAVKKQLKAGSDPGKVSGAMDLLDQQQQKVSTLAAELTRLQRQRQSKLDAIGELTRKMKNGYYKSGSSQALAMGDIKSLQDSLTRLETQDIAQAKEVYDREYEELQSGIALFEQHFMV